MWPITPTTSCYSAERSSHHDTRQRHSHPTDAFCTDGGARRRDQARTVRPGDPRARGHRLVQEAAPADPDQQPGHVRRAHRHDRDLRRVDRPPGHLRLEHHDLAVLDGALRELRRSRGRGPGQGAGGHAAPHALGDRGPPAARRRHRGARGGCRAAQGRPRRVRGERPHPLRRRDHRGHRLGRRVGHHRRVGPGHPRVRRRPLGGHRRHEGALGPHRRADLGRARPHVPRPDDRPRRGRQPAEDPERDRPDHPARGADDHLPPGRA